MIDWDAYRAVYDRMGWNDQVAFYDRVWELHPDQRHFDAEACAAFLTVTRPASVLEIGGWRGELANLMLARFPNVTEWRNVEVCRGAAFHPVGTDPRYSAVVPDDWAWKTPEITARHWDALVMSHTVEHMRLDQFRDLIDALDVGSVFLQAPLEDRKTNWTGYHGSHVLAAGWNDLARLLKERGFTRNQSLDAADVRCFARTR